MKIEKESDINGDTVAELRRELGMTQEAFWGAVLVKKNRGCWYETKRTSIPVAVRRLVYLHYVLGYPTADAADKRITYGGAAEQAALTEKRLEQASALLEQARNVMTGGDA